MLIVRSAFSSAWHRQRQPQRVKLFSRFSGAVTLILILMLVACGGGDIGSTAGTDPDTPADSEPGSGGNNPPAGPTTEPPGGPPTTGTAGDFSLSVPTSLALVEGSEGITIDLIASRQNGHDRAIQLALTGVQPSDVRALEYGFSTTTLAAGSNEATLTLKVNLDAGPITSQQRQLELTATDGEQTLTLTLNLAVEPTAAPDVYLLIGQSNMVGFSRGGEKQSGAGELDEPDARVRQLNVTGNDFQNFGSEANFADPAQQVAFPRFVTAEDPLHESFDPSINGKTGTFIGLGLSFGKAALNATEREVILVPAAWSGTGFCDNSLGHIAWNAVQPAAERGWLGGTALFDRALTRVNIALEESGGILRGILWHQGEADSTSSLCADDYADNMRLLIENLRSRIRVDGRGSNARGPDASIPFVLGTMSRGADERGSFADFDAVKTVVDNTHRSLPAELSSVALSNHDDLVPDAFPCGQGSCIHFGGAAYREMGRRYFSQIQNLWNTAN